MKKKDQILLEKAYQQIREGAWDTLYPTEIVDALIKIYTGKLKSYDIYNVEYDFVPDKPGNYSKMKEAIIKLAKLIGKKVPVLDEKQLNWIAKKAQEEIRILRREVEDKRKEQTFKQITVFDKEKRFETIEKLKAVGYKELQGDEYVDYDKSGKRIFGLKYFGKTIGGLFRGRSKEEDVVRVNPNGSLNEDGISVDEYLQYGRGKTYASAKKSFF